MTYSEALRQGVRLVNRNLHLVAIQAALLIVDCVGFFIIVGIPLGIAFVIFGLDLAGLKELGHTLGTLQNPLDLLTRYFGLVMIVIVSLLIYIIIVTTLWLFVFGGMVGIIGTGVVEPFSKFSMRAFVKEARRLFVPLMWYSLLIGLVFIGAALFMGFLSGGAGAVVSAAKSQDSTLALFLGIFCSLLLVLIGLGLVLGILATAVYGVAVIYFKGEGAVRSFATAVGYLWHNPDAFWLYVLLLTGYAVISFALMLVIYPLNLVPLLGPVIFFPFRLLSYVFQGYLGLVIMAVVFSYYHSQSSGTENARPQEAAETPGPPVDEGSSWAEDISSSEVPGQGTAPPATEQTE